MAIRFDEKGKFYSDVINKEAIQVIIQTPTNIIRGKIHISPGCRMKDEINRLEEFFAVTDATIYNLSRKEMYVSRFLAVNRDKIIWMLPESEISHSTREGGA